MSVLGYCGDDPVEESLMEYIQKQKQRKKDDEVKLLKKFVELINTGRLYTLQQVADQLGISVLTIRKWRYRYMVGLPLNIKQRTLCSRMILVGRVVRVPETAVVEFLNQ